MAGIPATTRCPMRSRSAVALTGMLMLAAMSGCSSMLLGGSGTAAGNPIGTDTRSSSQVSADNRISATIRARYSADPELSAAGLQVTTVRGTVTLRGTVSGFEQRDRAVRLAQDVSGVLRVDNQISVRSR